MHTVMCAVSLLGHPPDPAVQTRSYCEIRLTPTATAKAWRTFEGMCGTTGPPYCIIVEAVLFVPQATAFELVDGVCDLHKMFEELAVENCGHNVIWTGQ